MSHFTRPSCPNSSPLALHNARYNGWPSPPVQLPRVDSPSFNKPAEQRDAFAIDPPSNRLPHDGNATHTQHHPIRPQCDTHPHANSGVQDIMCPVESRRRDVSNSCMYNGGTRQNPSLQCAFETRTAVRHDKENAAIKRDPVRRTNDSMPLIDQDTQSGLPLAYRILAAGPCVPLVYDLRYPPTSLQFPPSSPYAGRGYELLRVPLTPRSKQIRLISQDFPWAFDIELSAGEQDTTFEVLTALHAALQRPLTDTEWGTAEEDKHASLIRARERRLTMNPALGGSLNSKASPTVKPRVRFTFDVDVKPAQRELVILRVDWLGTHVGFGGLVKDDAFARRRLIPGAREPPETWVVKFQRLV
ncbi:hypothetical protein DEU56DRAFT_913153 [Suillus clintonianus]|uniref:uncharacterized protein n=1 Tax=Suillus clintonianus TaxID=1904413 RepID=UPI001B85EF78|nr:uncharacterized protein DEU56DRAFT_913153 [Suillus clintonianus]KAG2135767.1 hypothetical protein DEU56DRAFT_913153 [Suillus clintonianus]